MLALPGDRCGEEWALSPMGGESAREHARGFQIDWPASTCSPTTLEARACGRLEGRRRSCLPWRYRWEADRRDAGHRPRRPARPERALDSTV